MRSGSGTFTEHLQFEATSDKAKNSITIQELKLNQQSTCQQVHCSMELKTHWQERRSSTQPTAEVDEAREPDISETSKTQVNPSNETG